MAVNNRIIIAIFYLVQSFFDNNWKSICLLHPGRGLDKIKVWIIRSVNASFCFYTMENIQQCFGIFVDSVVNIGCVGLRVSINHKHSSPQCGKVISQINDRCGFSNPSFVVIDCDYFHVISLPVPSGTNKIDSLGNIIIFLITFY